MWDRPRAPALALLVALAAAGLACAGPGPDGAQSGVTEAVRGAGGETAYVPSGSPLELGLAGYAKVLCSAVFVSGREPEEAARNSGFFFVPEEDRAGVEWVVDRDAREVRMSARGITRAARFYGDQGCVIHPAGHDGVFFEPVEVETALPPADTMAWPMGDVLEHEVDPADGVVGAEALEALAPGLDRDGLVAAVEAAFSEPEALTAAFLVVHRGRIVAERYDQPGVDLHTQLESWSMGKSLTATLVGLLVEQGAFGLWDPAPVPPWQGPDDPRRQIRIADLMRMSSGLHFIAPRDPDFGPDSGYPDHMYIYTGAVDAFEYSISRPLQFPPNTEGRYRNSDPLTLGYVVERTVQNRGQEYLSWPQSALFDRIGIRRQVLEPDPYGNFLLTGYDYGTARNWARLGLLYLQDGVWQGERLLPQGWVDFVRTPAPAWDEPVYGGLFWLNRTGEWSLPPDAYYMAGGGGQRTFVVPSLDLVVVRLGHFRGDAVGMRTLDEALGELAGAVPAEHR